MNVLTFSTTRDLNAFNNLTTQEEQTMSEKDMAEIQEIVGNGEAHGPTVKALKSIDFFKVNANTLKEAGVDFGALQGFKTVLDSVIAELKEAEQNKAIEAAKELLRAAGLDAATVFGGRMIAPVSKPVSGNTGKGTVGANYRNPENPADEWSGRGKTPIGWFKALAEKWASENDKVTAELTKEACKTFQTWYAANPNASDADRKAKGEEIKAQYMEA